ncbi:hypothetical protein E1B28_008180 [Marasmius oreades]|uniref:Uncharacterized protein n=1 Tax=Marasmius oreades TaxID=181124 RepID=A0A9P7RYG3_9AGAR|nr:uncharacterized protein E1B28_008180 [Marasmius oreades]KAG7091778.1 hypothetical protein E1B28_008180 [Marasmius oreades]
MKHYIEDESSQVNYRHLAVWAPGSFLNHRFTRYGDRPRLSKIFFQVSTAEIAFLPYFNPSDGPLALPGPY